MPKSADITKLSYRRLKADKWARKFARASLSGYDDEKGTLNKLAGYLFNCSKELTFTLNKDFMPDSLVHAFFCRNRFCPLCNYYKSIRESTFIRACLSDYGVENVDILICDFTFRNPLYDIRDQINVASKVIQNVMTHPYVRKNTLGFVKKFEMTFNSNSNSKFFHTFHPHYHFLICFPKGFKELHPNYFYDTLSPLWVKAMSKKGFYCEAQAQEGHWFGEKDQYNHKSDSSVGLAVEEITKAVDQVVQYTAKEDPLKIPDEYLLQYVYACKNLKIITYNGFFMDYRKKLLSGEISLGKLPKNSGEQNIHFAQLTFLPESLLRLSPDPDLLPSSSLSLISYRFYPDFGFYVEFNNDMYHSYLKENLPGWLGREYKLTLSEKVNDIIDHTDQIDEYVVDPLFEIKKIKLRR